MKRIALFIAAFAALVSFNSCKEEMRVNDDKIVGGYEYTFDIVDDITCATLSNTGVAWESSDKVGMYLSGYTGYADINTETTPTTAKLYSPSIIPADSYAYAYFPYDAGNDDKEMNHILLPNVQEGSSSSAMPLAGIPFKIESDIPAKDKPNGAINFMNLGSVIDFRIFSDTYTTETINYVTFTATAKKDLEGNDTDLAVSGDGYLDLTKVKGNDESTLELTFGLGTDYDYAKVNGLSVAVADVKANATTPIYLVVAPGIYTGTITIGTDAATYSFDYSNKTLARNVIKTYNMDLDNASRVAGVVETVESLPYSESFATGIGEFSTDGEQAASTDIWQFASGYGMKATAYINSVRYESETWLTSPWIDLTSVSHAYAEFEHVHRYAGTASDELTFWVLSDEGGAVWEQETIPHYASGSDWTFVASGEVSLDSYVGHKVKVAFKYISSTTNAATWEVKNVHVAEKVFNTTFTWDADDFEVEVGKTKSNNVTVNSGATITYDSDDTDIATVAADGTVTGVAEGSTTINVHVAANGNYPAKDDSFNVTVIPAAADCVTLDWDYAGGTAADLNAVTGVTTSGLGSDYAESHAPCRVKFDGTGDYIQVKTNGAIGTVSVGYKMIGGASTSYLNIFESTDGSSWGDRIDRLTIAGSQNSTGTVTTTATFSDAARYVKIVFEKGQNVGIGTISIHKPNTDPVIQASNINNVPATGVTNETASYTARYFADDVEVSDFTGCVSAATASAGVITYSVNLNYTTTAKAGTIVLWSASDHSVTKTIDVNQLKSTLSVSSLEVVIPADATTATFTVTTAEFGYNAVVASTEAGMNLSISNGASGAASGSPQTVTVSSNTDAPASGEAITLGTISVYRNGNTSDSQKKTVVIKKAVSGGSGGGDSYFVKVTALNQLSAGDVILIVNENHAAFPAYSGTSTVSATDISAAYDSVNDKFSETAAVTECAITLEAPYSAASNTYKLKMSSNKYAAKSGSGTGFLSPVTTPTSTSVDWTLSMQSARVRLTSVGSNTRGLIWRAGTTNKFGAYATNNVNNTEYYDVYIYKLDN